MDTSEFIIRTVEALIWPITIFALLYIFRMQIVRLIQRVTELSYKDIKVSFQKDLKEAEDTAKKIKTPELKGVIKTKTKTAILSKAELSVLAEYSPRLAIIEAWLSVETALTKAARKLSISAKTFTQLRYVLERLIEYELLEVNVLHLFNDLRTMRNKAAHNHELDISVNESMRFADLSLNLTRAIDTAMQAWEIKHKEG